MAEDALQEVMMTWIGTAASLIGAAIAVFQARRAADARAEVKRFAKQVRLTETARWLEHAHRTAAPLLNKGKKARGIDLHDLLERVQREFDEAFMSLPDDSSFSELREAIKQVEIELKTCRERVGKTAFSPARLCANLRDATYIARALVRHSEGAT